MAVNAGAKIRRGDFIGPVDDLTADVEELQAQAAQFAPTSRLRGMNVTMDGLVGTLNPAVSQGSWQGGTQLVDLDASGIGTLVFDDSFQLVLLTLIVWNGDASVGHFDVAMTQTFDLGSAEVEAVDLAGDPFGPITVRLNWLAIGL